MEDAVEDLFPSRLFTYKPIWVVQGLEDVSVPISDTPMFSQHILLPLCFQFLDNPKEQESITFPFVLSFTSSAAGWCVLQPSQGKGGGGK